MSGRCQFVCKFPCESHCTFLKWPARPQDSLALCSDLDFLSRPLPVASVTLTSLQFLANIRHASHCRGQWICSLLVDCFFFSYQLDFCFLPCILHVTFSVRLTRLTLLNAAPHTHCRPPHPALLFFPALTAFNIPHRLHIYYAYCLSLHS